MGEACEKGRGAAIVRGKEGIAVPAASAALALDHNHDSREPETQASSAPSASAPKKRGRPRITPPEALSPLARWVVEDRGDDATEVAKNLGITRTYLYHLMNGTKQLPLALAKKICALSQNKLDLNTLYEINTPAK